MGKVIARFGISLDGFIADANDGVGLLFRWLMGGDTPVLGAMGRTFMTSAVSAAQYQEMLTSLGALVTGRRDFDASDAWGGENPLGVPTFIVTHSIPQEWAGKGSPFIFVTDGVGSAIDKAKQEAGDKTIAVSGSKITQQAIMAGLLDEIHIDLVPVLLGEGIRLFENLRTEPRELEITSLVGAPGVTHLKYRIVR
jgi:dihydrofolate reductase